MLLTRIFRDRVRRSTGRYLAAVLLGLMAAIFVVAYGVGFAAGTVTSAAAVSESRAEAISILKMQQTHPGEAWSVTQTRLHLFSAQVSDSSGQTYGSPWTPCSTLAQAGPLARFTCPPPPMWAVELATRSKERKALVVVNAQSGVIQAVLLDDRLRIESPRSPIFVTVAKLKTTRRDARFGGVPVN
jgi:hypothetical protein